MDLTKLTREQLIEALTLYQNDIAELSMQTNVLTESNLKLFNMLNEKTNELTRYKKMHDTFKDENKKLIKQNLNLLDEVEQLNFSVKKQRALAITACIQAQEAKRKYRQDTTIHVDNMQLVSIVEMKECIASDDIILDNNGFYSKKP